MNQTQNQHFTSRNPSQSAILTPTPQLRTEKKKSHPHRYARAIPVAARYRHLVPRARSILFFGTKHARTIIRDDGIRAHPLSDYPTISFTRSLHVAVHHAMLQREDEEATGAILILDREMLRTRYKLAPYHDPIFDDVFGWGERSATEAEEMAEVRAIVDLKRYLLGVIWLREDEVYPYPPRRHSLPRRRSRARTYLRTPNVQPSPNNHRSNEFGKDEKVDRSS